ncbi:hypothetical protein ILUMI_06899, partial [Ignelater luminosus]
EEEVIRTVNKCCPGYHEDENHERCVSRCPDCVHGECDLNNLCNCHPGFWGEICDKNCPATRWGKNCEFDCLCENGDCDPISGYCSCPPGWKGNRCEEWFVSSTKSTSTDKPSTTMTSPAQVEEQSFSTDSTKGLSKAYAERTKYPILQKYYTFYITTENPLSTAKSSPNWQKTAISNTKLTSVTWLNDRNLKETTIYNDIKSTSINTKQREGNFTTQPSTEVDTVPVPVAYNATVNPYEDIKVKQEQVFVNNTEISDQVTQANDVNLKAKVVDDLEVSVTSTRTIISSKEEDWLLNDDESRVDPNSEVPIHQNQATSNESRLVFSVGAVAGAIATIVLIVGVALFTTKNYRKKKPATIIGVPEKHKNENTDNGGHQVSIYTRSVFHAPLPEPPVFENPVFTTPLEYENNSNEFGGTLEARVICSMHLPNHPTSFRHDSRAVDAFYDHPPSTGSYRAASIPEPPPEQTLEITSTEVKEHLYDEIPCWKQPLPINSTTNETLSSYYANTRM